MLNTRILTKLEQLEYYINQFASFLPDSEIEYKNSLKDQMAIERLFQVLNQILHFASSSSETKLQIGW